MDRELDQSGAERIGGGDRGADREWWLALRRAVSRLLDLAETAARADDQFRADLDRLFGGQSPREPAGNGAAPNASLTEMETATAVEGPPAASSDDAAGGIGASTAAAVWLPGPPVDTESAEKSTGAARAAGVPPAAAGAARESPPMPAPAPPLVPRVPSLSGPRVVEPAALPAQYPRRWAQRPFDPARVATSCRLKAEACRWQSERSRKLDEGEDVSVGDRELVTRAAAAEVWLWMVSPNRWRERSEAAFATVAGCYDALSDAAELVALAEGLGVQQEASLRLLGEAQSGVRAAVEDYASTGRDEDQECTFTWLRQETEARRVFVEHLRLDRLAPPDNHADLRARIAALRQGLDAMRRRGHSVENAIKRIAYHARKIGQRGPEDAIDADDDDLRKIAQSAAHLHDQGVPPSDVRLRDVLLPIFARLAGIDAARLAESAPALYRMMEAVDDHLDQVEANRQSQEERGGGDDASAGADADELVARARELVAGRDAVLIGGIPSEPHRARLERGLGLRSLHWLRLGHHESFEAASNAIVRPGVGLVMIMTRWRSHRDGPAARDLCRRLGLPLVELPAGYNLRQVAHRIVEQMPGG